MDTTEQLGGTYYFNGLPNLTPQELLFWVLVDETQKQLGVQDIVAITGLILATIISTYRGNPIRQLLVLPLPPSFSANTFLTNSGAAFCQR